MRRYTNDSPKDTPYGTDFYNLWKMASDGSGQVNIGNKGPDTLSSRQPNCPITNQIIHIRLIGTNEEVFTMNPNGQNV
jgi:hypothetical protein